MELVLKRLVRSDSSAVSDSDSSEVRTFSAGCNIKHAECQIDNEFQTEFQIPYTAYLKMNLWNIYDNIRKIMVSQRTTSQPTLTRAQINQLLQIINNLLQSTAATTTTAAATAAGK